MEYIIPTITIVVIAIILFALLASIVRIVPQSRAYVIEWLGAFRCVWDVGIHFKVPIFERVVKNVSLKEQVVDFPPQPVITKDNVTMQIDTVISVSYTHLSSPRSAPFSTEEMCTSRRQLWRFSSLSTQTGTWRVV